MLEVARKFSHCILSVMQVLVSAHRLVKLPIGEYVKSFKDRGSDGIVFARTFLSPACMS